MGPAIPVNVRRFLAYQHHVPLDPHCSRNSCRRRCIGRIALGRLFNWLPGASLPLRMRARPFCTNTRSSTLRPKLARTLAESGDALQFGGRRDGATAEAFDAFARALAILSFLEGGVKFCDLHLKNVHPDAAARR